MARRLLVPLDGSPQSEAALEHALGRGGPVAVTLLHVIDPVDAGYSARSMVPGYSEQWYEDAREDAEELLAAARESVGERAVEVETAVVVGRPTRAIVEYADEHGVDGIVMGSHGRSGVSRILLGSVAEAVVRRSPVPVTVVR